MTRLIDADAIQVFATSETLKHIITDLIDAQPTVDAVPVRHGKWKQWDVYEFGDTYECTACGEAFVLIEGTPSQNGYNYCPHCGAKMDAERTEE